MCICKAMGNACTASISKLLALECCSQDMEVRLQAESDSATFALAEARNFLETVEAR